MRDRSKEKETNALTSVRTVHSRALTAIKEIRRGNWRVDGLYVGRETIPDEDAPEMIARLEQVVELLDPWAKKRRRP